MGKLIELAEAPVLGGGLTPSQWLRMSAAMDCKKRAFARAREAEQIADWVDALSSSLRARDGGEGL